MGCHLVRTAVLLAAYNGSSHLPELLDSLLSQTDPDFFVLMQDDGSDDATPVLLRDIADRDERFLFGAEQGSRLGAAGNFLSLIRQADADYCLLCDQDDIWEPEKIAMLKQAMRDMESRYRADTPLLIHSDCSLINQAGERIGGSFLRHQGWDPEALTLPRLLVQNNVTGCTLIMNHSLCRLIASHAEARDLFMHDWFIALTAASFGRIGFVDQPLTRYRQHEGNAIGASAKPLLLRGLNALMNVKEAGNRIRLTYTHTEVFERIYRDELPVQAHAVITDYLATRHMHKLSRLMAVFRMGCVMQSPVTRLGQILFG